MNYKELVRLQEDSFNEETELPQSVCLIVNSFMNIGFFLFSGNDYGFDSRPSVLSISGRAVSIFGSPTPRASQSITCGAKLDNKQSIISMSWLFENIIKITVRRNDLESSAYPVRGLVLFLSIGLIL
jgi:hypothetical protein